jgi:hypothetical protein
VKTLTFFFYASLTISHAGLKARQGDTLQGDAAAVKGA